MSAHRKGIIWASNDTQLAAGAVIGRDLHAVPGNEWEGEGLLTWQNNNPMMHLTRSWPPDKKARDIITQTAPVPQTSHLYWSRPAPLALRVVYPAGALVRSAASERKGRMAACGQTNEQMLHCVQFSLFQVGTVAAMARFSMTVVPGGTKPPGRRATGCQYRMKGNKLVNGVPDIYQTPLPHSCTHSARRR